MALVSAVGFILCVLSAQNKQNVLVPVVFISCFVVSTQYEYYLGVLFISPLCTIYI